MSRRLRSLKPPPPLPQVRPERLLRVALASDRYDETGLIRDLDDIPFPAWDAVSLTAYGHRASLLSSRGCPAGCRFCAYVVAQGRQVRGQSIERTLAEWEWLAQDVRPTYLYLSRSCVCARPHACRGDLFRPHRPRTGAAVGM